MQAGTKGDTITVTCYNTVNGVPNSTPKNLTGLTVSCTVLPPGSLPGSANVYPWPGLLQVTNAAGGIVVLTTVPTCFPTGNAAPYTLTIEATDGSGVISYSRTIQWQVAQNTTG